MGRFLNRVNFKLFRKDDVAKEFFRDMYPAIMVSDLDYYSKSKYMSLRKVEFAEFLINEHKLDEVSDKYKQEFVETVMKIVNPRDYDHIEKKDVYKFYKDVRDGQHRDLFDLLDV